MRWWMGMLMALGVSVAGAIADARLAGSSHLVLATAYVLGCLVAVLGVSGPGLVAVTVEPPVVLLVAVGAAEALSGRTSGMSGIVLGAGLRVTSLFPVMAAVSGATVLVGLLRLWRHRSGGSLSPSVR